VTARCRRIDSPAPEPGSYFGFADVAPFAPGDIDGDGIPEIYASAFDATGPAGEKQGRAWLFNGATGGVLYELVDPQPKRGGQFGWSMAMCRDADGVVHLYIGNAPHHLQPPVDQRGGTNVFTAADGSLISSLLLPAPFDAEMGAAGDWGPNLGWSVAAPGDLTGNGRPDYVAGAPFANLGANQNQGAVIFFLAVDRAGLVG